MRKESTHLSLLRSQVVDDHLPKPEMCRTDSSPHTTPHEFLDPLLIFPHHPSRSFSSVLAVFAADFGTFGKGMYRGHSSRAYTVVSISCGYLAYDLWDTLRRRLYNPKAPSILAHNAILLVCFTIALYRDVTINYLILTLVCEVSMTLLHLFHFYPQLSPITAHFLHHFPPPMF